MTELKSCPFCGGPAKTKKWDGAMQATCAGDHECAGTDVLAPIAAWNKRAAASLRDPYARAIEDAAVRLEQKAAALREKAPKSPFILAILHDASDVRALSEGGNDERDD